MGYRLRPAAGAHLARLHGLRASIRQNRDAVVAGLAAHLEGVRATAHGDRPTRCEPYGRSSMQAGPSRRSTAPAIVSEPITFAVFVRAVNGRAEEACVITQGTCVEKSSATRPASSTPA